MTRIVSLLIALLISSNTYAQVRIKDVADFQGVRGNDLIGYGLVVGLDGTGDSDRAAPFTGRSLQSIIEKLGAGASDAVAKPDNVAAVVATAVLPPFARNGTRIDVSVSTIGDSTSLQGGQLLLTPLTGADGQVYAVAQGAVVAGGLKAEGDAAAVVSGVPTAGVVPSGARVEREISTPLAEAGVLTLSLREPDFSTASAISEAINQTYAMEIARPESLSAIRLSIPSDARANIVKFISRVEQIAIAKDTEARVVLDQKTGTIVFGQNVRILPVAVSHGAISVRIREQPLVSQPSPFFSQGETTIVPRTDVELGEQRSNLVSLPTNSNLDDLVQALNQLDVSPNDLISIVTAIDAAGALPARVIVR
ncbi:MAG: flagellar basal body P-ring protein FlgI [Geminicoccaceae bacterium]